MSTVPPRDSGGEGSPSKPTWRARYDAARDQGVPLDPQSEPVQGVEAYPTAYAATHLLITAGPNDLEKVLDALVPAAADFGWGLELQNLDGTELALDTAIDRARRGLESLRLPTIYRVHIRPEPSPLRDDQPVPPIDAWRLLQRARARAGDARKLTGVSLDHVLSINPFKGTTNPFKGTTNPFKGTTNPFKGTTNPVGVDSYLEPGHGGRQVVSYVGTAPSRRGEVKPGGRRPVVAVLDTGCGVHEWLPDQIVTRYPTVDQRVIGIAEPSTDPEVVGDVSGAFDGMIDDSSGHGTFIAGIIRQVSPEADIVAIRVADSQGTVLEGQFMLAVRSLVKWMAMPKAKGGRQIDVLNLSLGYYHETPEPGLFDRTLSDLLVVARRMGCAVVCSAGNDATDRPAFPASLWAWKGADFAVADPRDAAPHVSVGALNPNGSVALFSNIGGWVTTFAPGAAVLSTHPRFNGGLQPGSRDDRDGKRRETIDPDDFESGFALWSGTSFAAPYVAAALAAEIAPRLMAGELADVGDRVSALKKAKRSVQTDLAKIGPRTP